VVFVCPVRHPGDVLVSLWHHVRNRKGAKTPADFDYSDSAAMLGDGSSALGEHTRRFVETGFHYYLNLSIAWLGLPESAPYATKTCGNARSNRCGRSRPRSCLSPRSASALHSAPASSG
jgi:hypothetical protein